jgi:hypothetical protein
MLGLASVSLHMCYVDQVNRGGQRHPLAVGRAADPHRLRSISRTDLFRKILRSRLVGYVRERFTMSQPNLPVRKLLQGKEMSLTFEQVMATNNHCEVCRDRSTWGFLGDFYWRVGVANEYARKLENDLYEVTTHAQRFRYALIRCEDQLNEERLDHRASREELAFERARHQDTLEILDKVFHEATQSGEIVDLLSSQVTALRAASNFGVIQPTSEMPASPMEASLTKDGPTPSDESASVIQRRVQAKGPLDTRTRTRSPTSSGTDEGQHTTHLANHDPSDIFEQLASF